ncbi:hypothetical protein GH714_035564 [Hevea brasiliensis]|uniref:EF-hand domain-containing protein n=1 Tax=Hevea brasiliensis TaxID=3981 RepID=A0A6A6KY28_HEVBR|nr:hypothetical protein GH714_035564 [Hevea brasiliensis]
MPELLTLPLTKNILASSSSGNSDDEVDSPVDDAYTDVDEADSLDGITLSGDKSLGPAILHPCMQSDQAERERIFKRFDLNGDGKISAAELGECLKTIGTVTAEDIQRMMTEIDTDGDGFISYEEFTQFAKANSGLMKDVSKSN